MKTRRILLSAIAAPLALSPLVSAAIGYGMYAVAAEVSPACVCVQQNSFPGIVGADGTVTGASATRLVVSTCTCAAGDQGLSSRGSGEGRRLMPAAVLTGERRPH